MTTISPTYIDRRRKRLDEARAEKKHRWHSTPQTNSIGGPTYAIPKPKFNLDPIEEEAYGNWSLRILRMGV